MSEMTDWKAELDTFFKAREQLEQPKSEALHAEDLPEAAEFIVATALPAFEAVATALQEHGCRVRLRRGDASIRILVDGAGNEEFDYTLWVGTSALSTESHTGGRRVLGSFQNAKGTNATADTTQADVEQQLTATYVALNSPVTAR
jgi:hypothetical protein